MVYVNIGVIGTTIGTITNQQGNFSLNLKNQPAKAIIRFSTIGYQSQEYTVSELLNKKVAIELVETPVLLEAVTINPKKFKKKRLGTKTSTKLTATGWGGFGKGGERGLKIKVKNEVYLEALHFHILENSYDSILLRLHIRKLIGNIPSEELLREEILIPVDIRLGWVEVNLKQYNLSYDENFALTLEWIDGWSAKRSNLYFSISIFKGVLYGKEASEANWTILKRRSAAFYLDVLESQ